MNLNAIATFLGGLGLFLLGMNLMTDGLKRAAGPALHRILSGATRTRWHALGSGILVTAMVQSSSAVTVAAIGFVNAGLLGLAPALWVLFGANVGTTMTGWIVALVGLKFKVEALALPLIGIGVLLRLTGEGLRRGAFGLTLAGFGLLFLGIATLQQSFSGLAGQVQLPQGDGLGVLLAQLAIGVLMTVLMQSSSAAMTLALAAAQGGLIDAQGGAAVVIGANLGTTVTALLAAIGATSNARRAAAAHVVFNGLTGLVALALLPWLIDALGLLRTGLDLPADPAVTLALFHTCFNLLGVLLMWPLADALTRLLQGRFRAREEDEAQPHHLDDTVLAVPTLALDALALELARLGDFAQRCLRAALQGGGEAALAADRRVFEHLNQAISAFIERMGRAQLTPLESAELARLLRLQRYHENCADQALQALALAPPAAGAALQQARRHFAAQARQWLDGQLPMDEVLAAYQALKGACLAAGASGQLALLEMEQSLRRASALRRALEQAGKARQLSPALNLETRHAPSEPDPLAAGVSHPVGTGTRP